MKFLTAFEYSIGSVFLLGIFKYFIPEIYDSVLGNAFVFAVVFIGLLFFAKKREGHFKERQDIAEAPEPAVILIVILSVISLNLICWGLTELEVLLKKGVDAYLLKSNEIFMLGNGQKLFLTSLIVAPIVEELFFRRFLLTSLEESNSKMRALLFSSILFSINHLRGGDTFFSTLIYSFSTGYLYGWIFQKTKNIRVTIFAHFLWNLINYIFPLIMYYSSFVINSIGLFALWITGLLVVALLFTLLNYRLMRKNNFLTPIV